MSMPMPISLCSTTKYNVDEEETTTAVPVPVVPQQQLPSFSSSSLSCCITTGCNSDAGGGGEAMDVIVVSNNNNITVACSDFMVRFNGTRTMSTTQKDDAYVFRLRLLLGEEEITTRQQDDDGNKNNDSYSYVEGFDMMIMAASSSTRRRRRRQQQDNNNNNETNNNFLVFRDGRSSKPSTESLQRILLPLLRNGRNKAQYVLCTTASASSGDNKNCVTVLVIANFNIYHWSCNDRIVVCDIDGTITKSNVRGMLDTVWLERHEYAHDGVCHFLSQLVKTSQSQSQQCDDDVGVNVVIRILYLTSRPMSLIQSTRDFLSQLVQKGNSRLPEGPLFCHTGHVGQVLFSELVSQDTYQYKADVLFRQVVLPFAAAAATAASAMTTTMTEKIATSTTNHNTNIWYAGFGNSITDAMAYEMVGILPQNIYIIDKQSTISCMDKQQNYCSPEQQQQVLLMTKSTKKTVSTTTTLSSSSQRSLMTESMSMSSSLSCIERDQEEALPPPESTNYSSVVRDSSNNDCRNRHYHHHRQQQQIMMMKAVRRRHSYGKLVGTTFVGYKDPRLLPLVQAKSTSYHND